jgi:hypothetical protein
MTIGEQLEKQQPQIYNFLIDCFELDMTETDRVEPVEFTEDKYRFRKYQEIMQERKAVEI